MTNEDSIDNRNHSDPSFNVGELVDKATLRLDDLRKIETKRIDEKIDLNDGKYQVQFTAAKEAISIALIAQEKQVAAALDGTREAINKADATTDKRFSLLSEKIDGIAETMSKNSGSVGIYVTHTDLSNEMEKLRTSFESMLRPVITFMNSSQGTGKGRQDMYGWIVGGVMFVIAVVSFIIEFSH